MTDVLKVEYYSDILCVWAWIAERRNRELLHECGDQITLDCHFLDLFGDTETRVGKGWAAKGGYAGFAQHVRDAAEPYEDAPIHPDLWQKVRPTTSATAHLCVRAAQIVVGDAAARELASALRRSFFADAVDIGQWEVALELAEGEGLCRADLSAAMKSGRALAALLADTKRAHEQRVAGSPTWLLNGGRQILYGNIGYRVLRANVEELLRRPDHEASWC